jgi:hypothetical protein
MNESNLSYLLWVKYSSPEDEVSFAKSIPIKYLDDVRKLCPGQFTVRYRGPRYDWTRSHTLKKNAIRFSLYPKK